ncbi:hypothetical protein SNEBB_004972 [Seison nebaliae]|nr:hypothetical protein SNEBB_004972 [Seison nebaliae]
MSLIVTRLIFIFVKIFIFLAQTDGNGLCKLNDKINVERNTISKINNCTNCSCTRVPEDDKQIDNIQCDTTCPYCKLSNYSIGCCLNCEVHSTNPSSTDQQETSTNQNLNNSIDIHYLLFKFSISNNFPWDQCIEKFGDKQYCDKNERCVIHQQLPICQQIFHSKITCEFFCEKNSTCVEETGNYYCFP